MEMCLAWGLPPNVVEGLPRDTRREMELFFRWKVTREHLLRERAAAEQRLQAGRSR